jgi:type I restriction enzyme M protein
MALKKSELYSKLWDSCNELRGGMDASQYKDYILVLLFMRYVTDKYYGKKNALIEVPEGGSFHDLVALKGNPEIGDKTNKVISKMAEANDLVGVITVADFNDADKLGNGKDMVDTLSELFSIFSDDNLNFAKNAADGDDLLGDAYEYLMKNFASESGKSKGQFYTPAEVSRIMAKLIGIENSQRKSQTIYDPTCGSGSLLLKASDEALKGITIYGQEKDGTTVALAKMNMILHGVADAEIVKENTLSSPIFKDEKGKLKTFDFAVANPPFSTKSWSKGFDPKNDEFGRFDGYGLPPAKNGDYAFLLHFIKSLKVGKGKGAIILPHGVLFRGNAEASIRENIIKRGYLKGVIGLPSNLFYGTGIPAAILVIDKENAEARKGIFMIDASKGFIKDGNKNRLREQDVHKIVDVYSKQLEVPKYSKMVSFEEIEQNEFNLNIPRYIDNQAEEDIQDIAAHLLGGIPKRDINALEKYWSVYPRLKTDMFSDDRKGYYRLNIKSDDIQEFIFSHEDFINYSNEINGIINTWIANHKKYFYNINHETNPKELIKKISEDILDLFSSRTLIDKYDIYQLLMTYWLETMKDDIYMIVENGWIADKDLLPKEYIVDAYFKETKELIESYEDEKNEVLVFKEEFEEEFSGEEGYLDDLKNDKGNITKGELKKRIKEIKNDEEYTEEFDVLNKYLNILDNETDINKKIRDKNKQLDKDIQQKYPKLTEDEVKNLVIETKWIPYIESNIRNEMERVSYNLSKRITVLADRYDIVLEDIQKEVEAYSDKVEIHLKRMGLEW